MNIQVPKGWEIPESKVTAETLYRKRGRRGFLGTLGLGAACLSRGTALHGATGGSPVKVNPDFDGTGLDLTPFDLVASYNNFYEFGSDKSEPKRYANKGWKPEPWTVELTGRIRNRRTYDVSELIGLVGGIEQRVYRHRCVEAWSMVVPWDGFPLSRLVRLADPEDNVKFVKFYTFVDREAAIGQRRNFLDWPYVEGLHIDEAMNDLAFLATGIYGKAMPNQNGAPIRLVVPWKYGFKGIKSVVKIEFTVEQPRNSWNIIAPQEYGFLANVNPNVDHPRWSQAGERVIGAGIFSARQPTLMFNGYEKQVASLYAGVDLRRHF